MHKLYSFLIMAADTSLTKVLARVGGGGCSSLFLLKYDINVVASTKMVEKLP